MENALALRPKTRPWTWPGVSSPSMAVIAGSAAPMKSPPTKVAATTNATVGANPIRAMAAAAPTALIAARSL